MPISVAVTFRTVPPSSRSTASRQVTLTCTGCALGGFVGNVTAANNPVTISPQVVPPRETTHRFVTDAKFNGTRTTVGSASAAFANTDIGLRVIAGAGSTPATVVSAGSRIASVGVDAVNCVGGTTATLETGPAVLASGTLRFIQVGVATKTAPANNESAANLKIIPDGRPVLQPDVTSVRGPKADLGRHPAAVEGPRLVRHGVGRQFQVRRCSHFAHQQCTARLHHEQHDVLGLREAGRHGHCRCSGHDPLLGQVRVPARRCRPL